MTVDAPEGVKKAERLALPGYVVAQVAYRLSTEEKYLVALHGCKAALRFMRAHATEYKIDPARIGCTGGHCLMFRSRRLWTAEACCRRWHHGSCPPLHCRIALDQSRPAHLPFPPSSLTLPP